MPYSKVANTFFEYIYPLSIYYIFKCGLLCCMRYEDSCDFFEIFHKTPQIEILNPVLACCQGTLRSCKACIKKLTAQILLVCEI